MKAKRRKTNMPTQPPLKSIDISFVADDNRCRSHDTHTQPVDDGMLSCCKLWACDFSPSISVMPGWNDVKKWTKDSKHYTWIFNFSLLLLFLSLFRRSILFFSVRFLRFCHVKWMRLKICVSSVELAQNNTYRWNITWMKSDFVHVQANAEQSRETDGEMAKSIFMRWTPINFWMRAYWLWLEHARQI